jgi:hypothetical protein
MWFPSSQGNSYEGKRNYMEFARKNFFFVYVIDMKQYNISSLHAVLQFFMEDLWRLIIHQQLILWICLGIGWMGLDKKKGGGLFICLILILPTN